MEKLLTFPQKADVKAALKLIDDEYQLRNL